MVQVGNRRADLGSRGRAGLRGFSGIGPVAAMQCASYMAATFEGAVTSGRAVMV
jgi:hypothetical protein